MTKTATDTEVADMYTRGHPIADGQEEEVDTGCTRITWNQSGERTSHKESARGPLTASGWRMSGLCAHVVLIHDGAPLP